MIIIKERSIDNDKHGTRSLQGRVSTEILTTNSRNVLDEVKRLLDKLKKKAPKQEEDTISKEEILAGIDAGLKDVKAKRTRPATELLRELYDEL